MDKVNKKKNSRFYSAKNVIMSLFSALWLLKLKLRRIKEAKELGLANVFVSLKKKKKKKRFKTKSLGLAIF